MLALTLAVSLQLGAAELKPEAWVVVSRRSGVAKPQALDFARTLAAALAEHQVPTGTPVDDASTCNAKVPCLVELAQKKGVAVLITVEAGSALDDVVLHAEALSIDEFGKRIATFDFSGPANDFGGSLKAKVEELFAPAVRNVLGIGAVAKVEPVPEKKPDLEPAKPPPPEKKPDPPPVVVESTPAPQSGFGGKKIAGIVGMGAGAVLLVSSAALGLRAMGLSSSINTACNGMRQPCTAPSVYDSASGPGLFSQAKQSQYAGVGLLVSGAVLAAAGAVLFFVDFGGGSSATVTPSASSDGMGLTLVGRW